MHSLAVGAVLASAAGSAAPASLAAAPAPLGAVVPAFAAAARPAVEGLGLEGATLPAVEAPELAGAAPAAEAPALEAGAALLERLVGVPLEPALPASRVPCMLAATLSELVPVLAGTVSGAQPSVSTSVHTNQRIDLIPPPALWLAPRGGAHCLA